MIIIFLGDETVSVIFPTGQLKNVVKLYIEIQPGKVYF